MRKHPYGAVSMTAAATIQLRNADKNTYRREQGGAIDGPGDWIRDVRPCLAMYLVLAVHSRERVAEWRVTYMLEHRILACADTWQPTEALLVKLRHMRNTKIAVHYRHGAVIWRQMNTSRIEVLPESGAVVVLSPGLMWDRVDMMARLYDESTERVGWLLDRWTNDE